MHRDCDELQAHELNVANGILDLHTLELRDHAPDFFSTVQTCAAWQPHSFADEWDTFIKFAVPNEKDRWVIQQYFGYCLTGDTKHQKALFMVGEGRTGKGTVARTLSALLGGYNESSYATGVSFEALEDGGHLMPLEKDSHNSSSTSPQSRKATHRQSFCRHNRLSKAIKPF